MKAVVIAVLALVLTACSGLSTLEKLENEAMLTGDWSKVERHERILAKRAAERGPSCPGSQIPICVSWGNELRCQCNGMGPVFRIRKR